MKQNLFYFGLESVKSRYTYQLCEEWIPDTFKKYKDKINFIPLYGSETKATDIKVGCVLDAVGRGIYSLQQCEQMLQYINKGTVKDGDIIYLQDFWTPGIESIFYALDLYKIKDIKVYAMLHAQSVDEYDFTYPMKDWMRWYELGLDKKLTGIFVGCDIHKQQLINAGFTCKIHVVSLPIHIEYVKKVYDNSNIQKENIVIFSSRLDWEKNPIFMINVARQFLKVHLDWKWIYTTSGSSVRSNDNIVLDEINKLAKENDRFIIKSSLKKEEYYELLSKAKIQFNSSLQDYISWTVIEASIFGCDIVYPNFRSFPEFISTNRLYVPFKLESAIEYLNNAILHPQTHYDIADISDLGRRLEGYIMSNGIDREVNIWNEYEYFKTVLNNER
jgi:glycosyltransferase involved in cell wall biosynthesis